MERKFKRLTMIRRLPHTQVHIEAVQPRDIRLEHMAELENIPMVNPFVGERTHPTDGYMFSQIQFFAVGETTAIH